MKPPLDIDHAARQLLQARSDQIALRQFSELHPGFDIPQAYAVQERYVAMRLAEGRTILGHKVGMTSRAMQISSGIDEPDYGVLLDDMFFADGADIDSGPYIIPRVETEIAFVLGKDLAKERVSIFDVLDATDYVVPAVEIIDQRVYPIDPDSQSRQQISDTIADNAAACGVILGGRPVKPMDVDLRWVPALCYRNAIIEESGVSAAVLNHPAASVAWLAGKLFSHGVSLAAGEVILSGSFTRPVEVRAGDNFHFDFGNLGSVTCRFH